MKTILRIFMKCGAAIVMLFAILALMFQSASAQTVRLNKEMESICRYSTTPGWYDFREDAEINPLSIFTDYRVAFNLGNDDEMRMISQKTDMLGSTHYKYQQYYKGVKIFGAQFLVHQNSEGRVYTANGKTVNGLNRNAEATLSESSALQLALKEIKSGNYYWLNAQHEQELKDKQNDASSTWYPKGELILVKKQGVNSWEAAEFYLCWKFEINVENLHDSKTVFVDAANGNIIRTILLNYECTAGTGTTNYNGSISLNTQLNGANYRLWNDCQSAEIIIRNRNASTSNTGWTEYLDGDNVWTALADRSGVQAMYTMNQTRLYYSAIHSRNSFDNAGGDIVVYNNAGFFDINNNVYGTNAFASNDGNFYFGYGPSAASVTDDWNSVDVAGHEFTHFVTKNETGLVYQDESGALNESFSDIFGEMVESYTLGINDYLIGTDIGVIRSMINPNLYSQPDTYLGTSWCDYTNGGLNCTANDNGGVHTNSGVQNFFFYLLSEGGTGTNDNGTAYNVSGISRFTARDIGYYALTTYVGANDNFIDSREAWLHAAFDLYGNCSNEIIQVGNAWRAVGVGSQSPNYVNNACGVYPLLTDYAQAISYLQVANGCATTITPSTTTVYFHATDRVRIFPGFIAQAGSKFYAFIKPCDISIWRTADNRSDAEKGILPESTNDAKYLNKPFEISAIPNPFENNLEIKINLPAEKSISLAVYDVSGRLVKTILENEFMKSGLLSLKIETTELNSGIYFLKYADGEQNEMLKIVKSD